MKKIIVLSLLISAGIMHASEPALGKTYDNLDEMTCLNMTGHKITEPIDISQLDKSKVFQQLYNSIPDDCRGTLMEYESACQILQAQGYCVEAVEKTGKKVPLYIDLRTSSFKPWLYDGLYGAQKAKMVIDAIRKAAHDESATMKDASSESK